MNSTELIQAFKIGIDKVNALSNPSFETEEILFFLNKAKDRFEENLYLGRNSTGQSFDETERVKKALAIITKAWSTTTFADYHYIPTTFTAQEIVLPTDCKYVLRDYAVIQFATSAECELATTLSVYIEGVSQTIERGKYVPITAVRHNDLANLLQDPYIKPDNNNLLRIDVEDKSHVILHATNYTLAAYFMQYLRSSNSITDSVTYELPSWTHQKIVDIAVSIALENIESVRTQSTILDQIKND